MTIATNKVIWSEGMFIRPQHFQQHDRYIHALVSKQPNSLAPYHYGFRELSLNEALLDQGKVALLSANGLFQDGSFFFIPQQDCTPAPLSIPDGVNQTRVYLCVLMNQVGRHEVSYGGDQSNRYRAIVDEVPDSNVGNQELAQIEVGKLQLKLLLEEDDRSDYACMPILDIKEVRPDKKILYNRDFIPPLLEASASQSLLQFVDEIHGLLQHRSEMLANRLTNTQQSESAVVADFMLLQLVNRYETIFGQLLRSSIVHPHTLFDYSLQLMAEIATFTKDSRRSTLQVGYDHNQLNGSFSPLIKELRHCLSMVLEQHAVAITLESQSHGVYIGQVKERELLEKSEIVLAVYADVSPEELRKSFAMMVKISSIEAIRDLVSRGIPGVPMVPLAIAPRQIPYHANFAYFQIDQRHALWEQIVKTGSIALHVGGKFPNIRMELWAIRG
jgi:type VI secretion system protein ImpJ